MLRVFVLRTLLSLMTVEIEYEYLVFEADSDSFCSGQGQPNFRQQPRGVVDACGGAVDEPDEDRAALRCRPREVVERGEGVAAELPAQDQVLVLHGTGSGNQREGARADAQRAMSRGVAKVRGPAFRNGEDGEGLLHGGLR